MTATTKQREYVVAVSPEYAGSAEARVAATRTVSLAAESPGAAALAAIRALLGVNAKHQPRMEWRRSDPEGTSRFITRANKDGDKHYVLVALTAAEIAADAAEAAAIEATKQALIDAAAPDDAAFTALANANPGVRISLTGRHVRVEFKTEFGVEGEPAHDYSRMEIQKDMRGYDTQGWTAAEVRVGSATLTKTVAKHAVAFIAGIRTAAAVASMLDAEYPVGSTTPGIPENTPNPYATASRAYTDLLTRVVATIAGATATGGAS